MTVDNCVRFLINKYGRFCTNILITNILTQELSITLIIYKQKIGIVSEIEISACSQLAASKKQLLSNKIMKQIFINLLSQRFKHFGLKTVTANDDAELLIAKTAIPKT